MVICNQRKGCGADGTLVKMLFLARAENRKKSQKEYIIVKKVI